jgi:hypothetical protein
MALGITSMLVKTCPWMESLKPKAAPQKESAGQGAGMIKKTFIEFIPMASDMKALLHFYKENEHALKTLEQLDKPSHAEVMVAFKARKEQLQAEGAE